MHTCVPWNDRMTPFCSNYWMGITKYTLHTASSVIIIMIMLKVYTQIDLSCIGLFTYTWNCKVYNSVSVSGRLRWPHPLLWQLQAQAPSYFSQAVAPHCQGHLPSHPFSLQSRQVHISSSSYSILQNITYQFKMKVAYGVLLCKCVANYIAAMQLGHLSP